MIIRIFLFLFLLNISTTQAEVDLKNGNFFYSWTDLELSTKEIFWQMQRSYNSRVNRVGYFGQGWCSPLESKLTIVNENTISIQNCGSGESVVYTGTGEQWTYASQTINLVDDMYVVKVKGVTQLQFNKSGDLDAFWLRDEKAKIKYLNGKLNRLESPAGNLVFTLDSEGKISLIKSDSGKKVSYEYQGSNLISVVNEWSNTFQYEYDKLGNMITAIWPDKTKMKMSYDSSRDWVTSVTDRDQCAEKYEFASKKQGSELKVTSHVDRRCNKKEKNQKTYEFVFSKNSVIKKVKLSYGSNWKEINYNLLGKPEKVVDSNGENISFSYDAFGNLTQKKSKSNSTDYVLNSNKQIVQIKNSRNSLSLEYDERGRVSKINLTEKSQKKVEALSLSYVNTSEKIKSLELQNGGQLFYSYDQNGNLEATKLAPNENRDELDLQSDVNRIYGVYTTLTDESSVLGGLE